MGRRASALLDKLFPQPVPGTQRIIPSRHPIQIGLMVAFIISSCFQVVQGLSIGSVAIAVAPTLLISILTASIIGSMMCLAAAIFAERKPWDAIGLSLGGFFILTMVLCFSFTFFFNIPQPWLLRDFWTTICLILAFIFRFLQLSVDAIRIWRHRKVNNG